MSPSDPHQPFLAPTHATQSPKHASSGAPLKTALDDLGETLDLRRILHILLRRWWIIALITGTASIATAGYVMRLPKIYESRAVIQVQQQEQQVVKIDNITEENLTAQDFINTVVQSLSSRKLMLRVIGANNLRKNPMFVTPGSSPTDIQLADKLRGKVSVQLRKGTRLIDITVSDTDPVMARDLATSLVAQFLRETIDQRVSVSQVASEFLTQEAEKLKKKLEESESKLQIYKEEKQAVSLAMAAGTLPRMRKKRKRLRRVEWKIVPAGLGRRFWPVSHSSPPRSFWTPWRASGPWRKSRRFLFPKCLPTPCPCLPSAGRKRFFCPKPLWMPAGG
jgi:capsular polysaccharide biosynthesis protein